MGSCNLDIDDDSGSESCPEDVPDYRRAGWYDTSGRATPAQGLRQLMLTGDADAVQRELDKLLRQARSGQLSSSALCRALRASDRDGHTALHSGFHASRHQSLNALLMAVEAAMEAQYLKPADARSLFSGLNPSNRTPLQVFAAGDANAVACLGKTLFRLHAKGHLTDQMLAGILLADTSGETPFQLALRHGDGSTTRALFELAAKALKIRAVTPEAVCTALASNWLHAKKLGSLGERPLDAVFMNACLPQMEAVLGGCDALLLTGRLNQDRLRELIEPSLARTCSRALEYPQMLKSPNHLSTAYGLVDDARWRWFGVPKPSRDTDVPRS